MTAIPSLSEQIMLTFQNLNLIITHRDCLQQSRAESTMPTPDHTLNPRNESQGVTHCALGRSVSRVLSVAGVSHV